MSISIVILIAMVMVTTIVIVESSDAYKEDKVLSLFDVPRRHSHRSKKTREAPGHVEQCRVTNLREKVREKLERVNVFAFLDPTWYYSYRQTIMLELLKKRLEKSGFPNVLFFGVTPPAADLPEDIVDNDVEIRTWREISKNIVESEYFLDAEEMWSSDSRKSEIIFLQDTPQLGIWQNFHAAKDEVIIVDRCGKLTYQFIVPWSILYFPYVKAAILSTYREDPCGPCDVSTIQDKSSKIHDSLDYKDYLLRSINNSGETKMDKSSDTGTERTFTNLETTTTTFHESEKLEADQNRSEIKSSLSTNTYESITTVASTAETERDTEKNKSVEKRPFSTKKNVEITSPISFEQTQTSTIISTTEVYTKTPIYDSSNKEINTNSSFPTINNSNNLTTHLVYQNELDVSSEDKKEGQEVSREQELQVQKNEITPLRIILYAPHLHKENGTLQQYTHLVLKTGSPDYHGHFHSKTIDHEPVELKKSDLTMLNDKTLAQYVDTINESPGTYGEVADYWQVPNIDELNNKNENTKFTDYDYTTVEDSDEIDSKNDMIRPNDIDIVHSDTTSENNDEMDDFMQRRLIEHYNKLLPWIYYIL